MPTFLNQVKAVFVNFPGTTLVTGLLCYILVFLYIFQTFTETDSFSYCLSLGQVVFSYRVFRLLTAPFFHSGFFHLFFNVVALLGIGPVVESQKGSTLYALICCLLLLVSGSFFLILELSVYLVDIHLFAIPVSQSCVVGLSGLLFSLFVIDCNQVSVRTIQLFGRMPVRSVWLPWIFLLLIQAMLPGVSFLGHICGIFAGYLYVFGGLNWILPSCERIHRWDDRFWFSYLNNFVSHNDICCSAAQRSRYASNSIFSYQSLCPSAIQNWLSWKRNNSSEDSRFPGKGYRLGDDSSSQLLFAQMNKPQLEGKQSLVSSEDETAALSKTEDYGSVSVHDAQTE